MAKRRYEIEVREITDGKVTEKHIINDNEGNLLKRALILGDNGEHSVFAMIGCDRAEACEIIANNKRMRELARMTTIGLMIHGMAVEGVDDEDDEDDEEAEDNGELGESQDEKPEDL